MTTTEKLQRIRAKCEELLAIAAKRTPGKWSSCKWHDKEPSTEIWDQTDGACIVPKMFNRDALFIASCAGAAEAGWRSTIAAIDALQNYAQCSDGCSCGYDWSHDNAVEALESILAAWPEELL